MRLKAILLMKCSYCLQGPVFRKPFLMYPTCNQCGIRYERERGYFMMSVFVGYVMGFFIVLPLLLLLYLTVQPTLEGYLVATAVILVLAIPFIFHYARVIWLHLDELMDPRRDGPAIPPSGKAPGSN